MKRIAVGLWGGMAMDDLIGCVRLADRSGYEAAFLIESYADQFSVLAACARNGITLAGNTAGIRLPIVYPLYPEYVGYLPNPASHAGILRTVDALAT